MPPVRCIRRLGWMRREGLLSEPNALAAGKAEDYSEAI